jgi:hypothetical protein
MINCAISKQTFICNMENQRSSPGTRQLLGAALLGAAAGAIIALLFAPDKGSETRKKVMDTASDLADKLKKKARKVAENGDPDEGFPA